MDLRCRVDQLIDSNCHLELNSMNAGIVIIVVDSIMFRLFCSFSNCVFFTKWFTNIHRITDNIKNHNIVLSDMLQTITMLCMDKFIVHVHFYKSI